jgi:hypothetical protein
MTEPSIPNPLTNDERRLRALDRLLDLSQPLSRLSDISERCNVLARELAAQTSAATLMLAALFQELDCDPTAGGDDAS